MKKILIKLDYFLMMNSYRLPYKYMDKFGFPSKRLVKYCFNNFNKGYIESKVEMVAHMYAYDSTVTKEDLSLINNVHFDGFTTRERIRQYLCKFVRRYYK